MGSWQDFLDELHAQNEQARIETMIRNAEKYGDCGDKDSCKIP